MHRHNPKRTIGLITLTAGALVVCCSSGCRNAGKPVSILGRPMMALRRLTTSYQQPAVARPVVTSPQPAAADSYYPLPEPAPPVAEPSIEFEPVRTKSSGGAADSSPELIETDSMVPPPVEQPELSAPPVPDFDETSVEKPSEKPIAVSKAPAAKPRRQDGWKPSATPAVEAEFSSEDDDRARPVTESPATGERPASPVTSPPRSRPIDKRSASWSDADLSRPLRPAQPSGSTHDDVGNGIALQSFDSGTRKPEINIDASAPPRMSSGRVRRLTPGR